MKRTPLRKVSPRRRERSGKPGKLGIVRLFGPDMEALRRACYARDHGMCQHSGCVYPRTVAHYEAYFDGDPLAYDMAHLKSKGAGGSDVLENVVTKHHVCHMLEHAGKR